MKGLWPTRPFSAGVGQLSPEAQRLLEVTESLYEGIRQMVAEQPRGRRFRRHPELCGKPRFLGDP
jgi:hypothetical protein